MDGDRATERIPAENPDLVLLDLGLPGKDGIDIIREVREKYFNPIVIVTAKSELEVHALGLNLGASDFLKKPVRDDVLLAHVECRLRERNKTAESSNGVSQLSHYNRPVLRLALRMGTASINGRNLLLTSGEFELLLVLARFPGEAICRSELSKKVTCSVSEARSKALDMVIHRLRTKLGPSLKGIIQNRRNTGFRLSPLVVVEYPEK